MKFLNLYMTAILILSDAFWFGYCYEKKGWLKGWLFKESPLLFLPRWVRTLFKLSDGEVYVPYYRLLVQWPLDVLAVWLLTPTPLQIGDGLYPLMGMLIAWYFMVKEFGYYIVLGQLGIAEEYEKNSTDVYWLKRIYFSGFWLFKGGYTFGKFWMSFVIGLVILIISNFL